MRTALGFSGHIDQARRAGQRARAWAAWALHGGFYLAHVLVLPAALLCLWHALQSLPATELRALLGRDVSLILPGDRVPFIVGIPAVVTWPMTFVMDVVTHAIDRFGQWTMTARDAATGIALLIAANILGYLRQDRRNMLAHLSVSAWVLLVVLTLFDLYAFAEWPSFWRFPKGDAWPAGAYLRLAEMICLGVLAGTIATIIYNRVRPDMFQPLGRIMFPVWYGLAWRGALATYAIPWLMSGINSVRGQYLRHASDRTDILAGYAEIAVILLVAWIVVGNGMLRKLKDAGRIFHLMILMRGPLPHDAASRGVDPNSPSQNRVGWS